MGEKIVLLYHEVADDIAESGFQNKDNIPYIHKVKDFARDLEVVEEMKNKISSDILFTFDDGGVSNLRSAEMLTNIGMKGYFFITTSKIGQPHFLDKEGIREIASQGHIIGSHSHTHPMIFKNLSYKQMLEEWSLSKQILEEILEKEVNTCSVPGGDSDKKTYESAREASFSKIFDSEPVVIERFLQDMEILGRISIKNTVTEHQLRKILTLEALPTMQRIRKLKKIIKTLIFPIHNYLQNRKNEVSY